MMRVSRFLRILFHSSLVTLAVLSLGILTATVSAEPTSVQSVQLLPTRPPSSKPPAPKPTSEPSSPQPSSPTQPRVPAPTPPAISDTTQITTTDDLVSDFYRARSVDLTFEELGHRSFGLSEEGSRSIYVYFPRTLTPNNAQSYIDLSISHVPPEPDKLSVLKVTLNDVPLAVITLSPENAELTTSRHYLGNVPLLSGRNVLRIVLDSGASCNVRGARVEVAVSGDSVFHLEYSLSERPPDLALYPVPFFEQSFDYEPVYVVLPENPSATDLSAAATIAAGLGKFSNGEMQLASAVDSQASYDIRSDHHLIVVGRKGANGLLEQLNLPLGLDDPTLSDEEGVIQELASPWNPLRMVLAVTGNSDEGLYKASQALNREVHLFSMRGSVATVQTVLPPAPAEDQQRDADFTLADLGNDGEVVYGTRPHILDYYFYMPLGGIVTEEPRFILYFGHARIADATASSLDVYFNDVPIESVLLDEGNASEGVLEVSLPSWLVRSGRNKVRVSIEMNLEDEDKCLFLDSQHLWTAVYSHSYFHVPFVTQDVEPALDLFPYPFSARPNLSGVLLILPDSPQQADYDLMLKLAVGLGAANQGDSLALRVITADLFDQEDHDHQDILLIGRPSQHSLMAELNDQLPQPFEPGSDMPRLQLESVVFAQDTSRDIGLIEEFAVPWDLERTILVVTGTTDEGVALASTALFPKSDELSGNVALIEEFVGVQAFNTGPLLATPESVARRPESNQSHQLIELGERWW